MKLRQLQCFCAVVDSGFNISRAATRLHATQPAISKQLRQFEDELGAGLLLRAGGRPVGLTPAGEGALTWARRALQCADNLRKVVQEGQGQEGGSITLATNHTHATSKLLPAIAAFRRRHPKVGISVLEGPPDMVAQLVKDGRAVLGITNLPSDLSEDVVAVPFLESPRVIVVPTGHPLLAGRKLTLERIAAFPLVVPYASRPQGARILDEFRKAGLEVNVAVQAVDADAIKAYVGAGLGVGIVPGFTYSARKDRGLKVRDIGHLFNPVVSVVLLRRQSQPAEYVFRFLAELDARLEQGRLEELIFTEA